MLMQTGQWKTVKLSTGLWASLVDHLEDCFIEQGGRDFQVNLGNPSIIQDQLRVMLYKRNHELSLELLCGNIGGNEANQRV